MSSNTPSIEAGGLTLTLPPELVDAIAVRVADLLETERLAEPEPWVGVEEAAAHLGCKPQRIYDLVTAKRIPHRHEGRRVLFRLSELDRWLEEGRAA